MIGIWLINEEVEHTTSKDWFDILGNTFIEMDEDKDIAVG